MNLYDNTLDILLDHTCSKEWEDIQDFEWTTAEVQEMMVKAINQVKNNVALGDVSKRSFIFDYLGKTKRNELGVLVVECLSDTINAYDEEHAIALFKERHPDTPFDPPY